MIDKNSAAAVMAGAGKPQLAHFMQHNSAPVISSSVTSSSGTDLATNMRGLKRKEEPAELSIEQIINDPALKENCILNARFIQDKMRGAWFTVEAAAKKCGFKEIHIANDVLNLLCLLELAYRQEKPKGTLVYKITFAPADRLVLLKGALAEAKGEVARIERQISKISNNKAT